MNLCFFQRILCPLVVWMLLATKLLAAEINVFAAASLTDALKELAASYEKQSGDKLVYNLGASSTLARQIEEGAPADIFFSADEAKMDALQKRNLIHKETRNSLLSNSLVIVAAVDSSIVLRTVDDLTNSTIQRIALADPKAVPAGIYSKSYLQKKKIWSLVEAKVVPTENVRGALAAVESGNVEMGMVYKTDAAISKKVKIACEVTPSDGPDISYPMALVAESKHPEAAKRFLQFLKSTEAAKVFQKFGFIVRRS